MVLQILFNGVIAGALYILSGLSFGIIYTSTGIFHFANIAAYTLGGLFFFQAVVVWKLHFFIGLVLSLVVVSMLGIFFEWVCYRPLQEKKASPLQIFLTSVGIAFVFQNIYLLLWSSDPKIIEINSAILAGREIFNIRITYLQIVIVLVVALIWTFLHFFIEKTKTGKAIRAFAADPDTAELMGIDTRWLRIIVFAIGSSLISIVAQLQIIDLGIDLTSGFDVVIIGTIAALLGGKWGITGIAIVSLLIGLVENSSMIFLSVQWKYIILFGSVIILLYLRPKAIFGKYRE